MSQHGVTHQWGVISLTALQLQDRLTLLEQQPEPPLVGAVVAGLKLARHTPVEVLGRMAVTMKGNIPSLPAAGGEEILPRFMRQD